MEAQLQLVHYYLDNELNENALFITERLHASNPKDHTWSHLRALACLRLGRHALAAEFSHNAATNGQHLGCAYVYAQACLKLKNYTEGIDVLTRKQFGHQQSASARFSPDSSVVNRVLGQLHRANGDNKAAAACFVAALQENPFMWDAFTELCDTGVKLSVPNIFKLREEKSIKGKIGRLPLVDLDSPDLTPTRNSNRQRKPLKPASPHTSQSQSQTHSSVDEQDLDAKITPNDTVKSAQSPNVKSTKKRPQSGSSAVSAAPSEPAAPTGSTRGSRARAAPRRSARLMQRASISATNSVSDNSNKENVKHLAKPKKPIDQKESKTPSTKQEQESDTQLPASLTEEPLSKEASESKCDIKESDTINSVLPTPEKLSSLIGLVRKIGIGYYHLSRFQPKICLEVFASLPAEQQSTPWVLSKTGKAHYELMSYQEAKTTFQALRKLAPTWTEDLEVYSNVLWHLKQDVELAFLAHELCESQYLSPQAWCAMGNSFSARKSRQEAMKAFRRACQLSPPVAQSFSLLGHELAETEDYPGAVTAFRQALQVDARHYPAWVGLGRVKEKLGEKEQALEYYLRAEKVNSSNAVLMTYIARVLETTGKHGLALGYLRRGLGVNPPNNILCLIRMQTASIFLRMGQPAEALKHLHWVEKCVPDEAQVHLMLGRAYAMLGEDKRSVALKSYTIALSLAPWSEDIKLAISDLEDSS
ncbi:hypothetical protein B0T10DRAFT_558416 [Thelonectria olida]|uniref:Uncharacterized protein n=1 Tax=Thelonectria olida TaxID=1576542 RepID=A0A9P8WB04_9HYPO|nr:hypothetical protein B0T10DRAFT_558416 [Thelonectria olida]